MDQNTATGAPGDSEVTVEHEVDDEALVFACQEDADDYALTGDESFVARRLPGTPSTLPV